MNARTNKKNLKIVEENNKELAQASTPADQYFNLVAMSMRNGDLNQAQQMMEMKREFEADEARKAYSQAMSKFRGICPHISKDSHVSFNQTSYSHETLDGILSTISPALSECGLSPTFRTNTDKGQITVICRVTHADGHYEETSLESPPDSSGKKNAIQSMGSTITYLQRYTLKALLGLSAGIDNDANLPQEPLVEIELVNKEQVLEITAFIDENNIDTQRVDKLLTTGGINKIDDIQSKSFNGFKSTLKQMVNN